MRRVTFLLVLALTACDGPIDVDPIVDVDSEDANPGEEAGEDVPDDNTPPGAEDPDEDPPTDPEALAWWQAQRVSEQALTSGRLSHVQVAEIRRRQRRRAIAPEDLDQVWNVPREANLPQEHLEALGLHRICGSETEWRLDEDGNPSECEALLQTIRNIRSTRCDNRRFSSRVRVLISQCRTSDGRYVALEGPDSYVEGAEETLLSAMRRASKYVMGAARPRSSRQRWVRNATLDCEEPDGFPDRRSWTSARGRSMQDRCLASAQLARSIFIDRTRRPRRVIRGAIPITWGGRCERVCEDPADPSTCSNRGACDDSLACRRRLARIPGTDHFSNAYWCRPGSRGCPRGIDPVCRVFLPHEPPSTFALPEAEGQEPNG